MMCTLDVHTSAAEITQIDHLFYAKFHWGNHFSLKKNLFPRQTDMMQYKYIQVVESGTFFRRTRFH